MKKIFLALLVLFGLQTQAQTSLCDSIEISITVNTDYYVELETNLTVANFPQILYVDNYFWGKNGCLMGTDSSVSINFNTDTSILYAISLVTVFCDSNLCYTCTTNDTLVWNNGSWNWMSMMNMLPLSTSIQEFQINTFNNNKIYDLMGREVTDVPIGTVYIRNNQKFIRIK